jgi:hypothetical protein
VLGDETLRAIARELVEAVRNNATIDWILRENVRVQLPVLVKHSSRLKAFGARTAAAVAVSFCWRCGVLRASVRGRLAWRGR